MADAPGTSTAAAAVAPPSDNNQALHKAIEEGDLEKFMDLLHQPGIHLNYWYKHGQWQETPLTASIKHGNSRMAQHLMEAGCDVNLENYDDKSPLHIALRKYERVDVTLVQMLLHNGADLNATFSRHSLQTPLLYAIYHDYGPSNNLEITSMLLYYGADVNITTWSNETPFQLAVNCRMHSCAEVLLNYYDDFSNSASCGDVRSILDSAVRYESPLVPALLERGADVNSLEGYTRKCLLHQTYKHTNAKMFKYIWSRINHQLLMKTSYPFLLSYIEKWKFANCEYLECLDLILESPIAHHLIEHCIDYLKNYLPTVVGTLLYNFKNRKILPKDRLTTIYTCLSLGIKINTKDLLCAIENYGFNEKFKALLYAGDFNCCNCVKQIKYFKQWKEDFYLKGFSSFSFENKQHAKAVNLNNLLATSSRLESETMLEALSKVPKFPSLLELSRNVAQKFIEQEFSVTKLYQFYDVVSCLKLPQTMKDVILLVKPIYDDVTIIK